MIYLINIILVKYIRCGGKIEELYALKHLLFFLIKTVTVIYLEGIQYYGKIVKGYKRGNLIVLKIDERDIFYKKEVNILFL